MVVISEVISFPELPLNDIQVEVLAVVNLDAVEMLPRTYPNALQENQINHEVNPDASTNNLTTEEDTVAVNEIDCEDSQNALIDPTPSELNKVVEASPT